MACVPSILFFAAVTTSAIGQTREYDIKAVFLYNCTRFVTWPETAFESGNAPFVIGVLGEDPFGRALDEAVQDEKVGSHPIVVQRFPEPRGVNTFHILFISKKEQSKL